VSAATAIVIARLAFGRQGAVANSYPSAEAFPLGYRGSEDVRLGLASLRACFACFVVGLHQRRLHRDRQKVLED
jgi:hypothetical protein